MALARAPGEYRLGDVLRQLEDNPTLIDCASPPCVIRGLPAEGRARRCAAGLFNRLDQYTLEDVLRPPTGASLITLRERAG